MPVLPLGQPAPNSGLGDAPAASNIFHNFDGDEVRRFNGPIAKIGPAFPRCAI